MARFAMDCLNCMHRITKDLVVTLGPDTCNLSIRIGVHSGPVTGGFLKGRAARFQLFGDTMNTTSRIQTTGLPGRIQISADTANLLKKAGKDRWVQPREDVVHAKGKGAMETYWLSSSFNSDSSVDMSNTEGESISDTDRNLWVISHEAKASERQEQLVDWNVQVLKKLIKQIVARRNAAVVGRSLLAPRTYLRSDPGEQVLDSLSISNASSLGTGMPLDEVKEIIKLPDFDKRVARRQQDAESIELSPQVMHELKLFVVAISSMYQDNPFHNFAHAS
jgi:hypothetical protein